MDCARKVPLGNCRLYEHLRTLLTPNVIAEGWVISLILHKQVNIQKVKSRRAKNTAEYPCTLRSDLILSYRKIGCADLTLPFHVDDNSNTILLYFILLIFKGSPVSYKEFVIY